MVSSHTLVKIAAIGGMVTVTMGFLSRHKLNERICRSEHYKDAMKTLRGHKGAAYLLGEPIKDCSLEVADVTKNFTKDLTSQYEIPIKGSKQRGTLFFWANRKSTADNWTVHRIELALKNEPHRRLLVKDIEETSK